MSWYRQMIFGQDRESPGKRNRLIWIAVPVTAFLFWAAWHYGIVVSAFDTLKLVAVATWTMLRDVCAACGDLMQYIFQQAGH